MMISPSGKQEAGAFHYMDYLAHQLLANRLEGVPCGSASNPDFDRCEFEATLSRGDPPWRLDGVVKEVVGWGAKYAEFELEMDDCVVLARVHAVRRVTEVIANLPATSLDDI